MVVEAQLVTLPLVYVRYGEVYTRFIISNLGLRRTGKVLLWYFFHPLIIFCSSSPEKAISSYIRN